MGDTVYEREPGHTGGGHLVQEGAHQTPLGPSCGDVVLGLTGTPIIEQFKSYLRIRPYTNLEKEECKKAKIDPFRSHLEFDTKASRVCIEDQSSITEKKQRVEPKKSWKSNAFTNALWSFSDAKARWDDDVEHKYYDQSKIYEEMTDDEDTIKRLYEGYSQSVIVHGATGSGKTYTVFGDSGPTDTFHGIAPRLLNSIFEGRRLHVNQKHGEKVEVTIEMSLLRVWKENIEDFTVLNDPLPCRITGEGVLEGVEPMVISSIRDVQDAVNRILKFGKRKEHRSHVVVHFNIKQKSTFAIDSELARESVRAATYTVADIGSGNRMESESQNDGKLITKGRSTFVRLMDMLMVKTEQADEAPKRREKNSGWKGNGVLDRRATDKSTAPDAAPLSPRGGDKKPVHEKKYELPKVPYKESKLTQLLCEQLGGCCMTRVLACVTPFYKHQTDNTMTIDLAAHAARVKSRVYRREERDLATLREVNEEKIRVSKHVTEVSENVQKVSDFLMDRQVKINHLTVKQRELEGSLESRKDELLRNERVLESYSAAISSVRTLHESGPINRELLERLQAALKEQEAIRRKMALLKTDIIGLECQSGEKNVRDLEIEIEKNTKEVEAARSLVAAAVESEANHLLDGDATFRVGEVVEYKRDDTWQRGTITGVTGKDKFKLTGVDLRGQMTEEEHSRGELRDTYTSPTSPLKAGGDSEHSSLLLLKHLQDYIDNECTGGLEGFTKLLSSEIRYARDRLKNGGSSNPGQREDLRTALGTANDEFVGKITAAVKETYGEEEDTSSIEALLTNAYKKRLDAIVAKGGADPLAKRLEALRTSEQGCDWGEHKISSDRAVSAFVRGVDGDLERPPSHEQVLMGIEVLNLTKERLAVVKVYAALRGQLDDSLEEWTSAQECILEAMAQGKELEEKEEELAALEAEVKGLENDCEAEQSNLEKAEGDTKQKQQGMAGAKKGLEAANAGCCSVM